MVAGCFVNDQAPAQQWPAICKSIDLLFEEIKRILQFNDLVGGYWERPWDVAPPPVSHFFLGTRVGPISRMLRSINLLFNGPKNVKQKFVSVTISDTEEEASLEVWVHDIDNLEPIKQIVQKLVAAGQLSPKTKVEYFSLELEFAFGK